MGKPAVGRQRGQATGGSHDLVGTRERRRGATTPTARAVVGQGRTTVGRQGAPRFRSRVRHRSLARAALPLPRAGCQCAGRKATSCSTPPGASAKPGRAPSPTARAGKLRNSSAFSKAYPLPRDKTTILRFALPVIALGLLLLFGLLFAVVDGTAG